MKDPTITVVMTINNRPRETMRRVFDSFKPLDNEADDMVVVLDGVEPSVLDSLNVLDIPPYARFVEVKREPGWICPAVAWNTGFGEVRTELTYCISSEVIQQPGNVCKAKRLMAGPPGVLFGHCRDDGKEPLTTHPTDPNLLCGTKSPRPLGFIMCLPTWALRVTGGYDTGFMEGLCFEDDDFTWRLWRLGLPFVFDDSVSGIHQHHDRPQYGTQEWMNKLKRNEDYINSKWGNLHPWNEGEKPALRSDGRLVMCSDWGRRALGPWKEWLEAESQRGAGV